MSNEIIIKPSCHNNLLKYNNNIIMSDTNNKLFHNVNTNNLSIMKNVNGEWKTIIPILLCKDRFAKTNKSYMFDLYNISDLFVLLDTDNIVNISDNIVNFFIIRIKKDKTYCFIIYYYNCNIDNKNILEDHCVRTYEDIIKLPQYKFVIKNINDKTMFKEKMNSIKAFFKAYVKK